MRDALTIGINTYHHLPQLKTPARDADAIARVLEQYSDFRVQRLPEVVRSGQPAVARRTPVSLGELEAALIRLFKPSGSYVPQTALFYFSGHGIQRHAGIREGYLALSESWSEAGVAGLSLFWLRRLLQESPVRQRIVILDCCHSGELLTFCEADPGARPGTDRMFMVACRDHEAAYESLTGEHSTLTEAILDGLDPRRCPAGRVTNYSLTNLVSRALQGQPQQPLFENSGGEILLTSTGLPSVRQPEAADSTCPYPGLAPFEVCHADYFFGREDLTRQLIDEVLVRPLVTVFGPSGCGKSSLLRAGFMAQLQRGQAFTDSDRWRVRLMVPGDRPLKQLAAAFIDPDSTGLDRAEQLRRAETFLQDGGLGLTQLLHGNLLTDSASGLGPRPRFVLVIDQFEMLLTPCSSPHTQRERQQVIEAIVYGMREAYSCFRVVIGLRADYLSHCLQTPTLAETMQPGLMPVPPLSYEQLKAAILKPAQKVALQCEPGLVYSLLFDLVGTPGELPLLQGALRQLWQHRQENVLTQTAYTTQERLYGILSSLASQVFHTLSAEHQQAARTIFLALTRLGDGAEDTRRRILKSDLLQLAPSAQPVADVLDILAHARLVMVSRQELCSPDCERPPGEIARQVWGRRDRETVDIIHESLIRRWPLLQGWLNENREMFQRQRYLEQAALAWNHAGQPAHVEYLLQGRHLLEAEALIEHPQYKPGPLMQQYVALSRATARQLQQERRRLQLALPSLVMVTLLLGAVQYYYSARLCTIQTRRVERSQPRMAIAQAGVDGAVPAWASGYDPAVESTPGSRNLAGQRPPLRRVPLSNTD